VRRREKSADGLPGPELFVASGRDRELTGSALGHLAAAATAMVVSSENDHV